MDRTFIKTNIISYLILSILLFVLIVPFSANAQLSGLTYVCPPRVVNGVTVYGECTFNDVLIAIRSLANWGTLFAIQFSVVVLAWAGFKYMTSGDNPSERREANRLLTNVVKGIVLIIIAWTLVRLIITGLGVTAPTFLG